LSLDFCYAILFNQGMTPIQQPQPDSHRYGQLTFTGKIETPDSELENYPPEIQEALSVISGTPPPGMREPSMNAAVEEASPNPLKGVDDPRAKFLKKNDRIERFSRTVSANVRALDLTNQDDQATYEKFLLDTGDPRTGITGDATPVQVMLDPAAPRGFRAIVVVRFGQSIQDVRFLDAPISQIPPATQQ